ncbi:OmpA family protein [Paraburkholderia sp. SOS3]|uniref:OmpA family protein n=1 Tax=Paraburkholderia sp. SOS3 TaxID=1926494 RepID=UPI001E63FA20|nr:OmpA family protein [Paraburkholderia sp. SOS3]
MAHGLDRPDNPLTGRSVTGYPYRTLTAWVAILALIWLALCSPWSSGWNVFVAVLAAFAALAAIAIATRRIRARRDATRHVLSAIDTALASLPSGIKRNTPLVIAVSEENGPLADAFGTDLLRITDRAIWIRCEEPARLVHLADALKRWRDGQGPDAVACMILADRTLSQSSLAATLKRWRSAIGEAGRAVGYRLPVCIAVYAEEIRRAPDECPWFGVSSGEPLRTDSLVTLVASRVAAYIRTANPLSREPRAHRAAQLDSLARWACDVVLPPLVDAQRNSPPLRVAAFGVTTIEGRPAPDSLFGQFAASATGLARPVTNGARSRCPLPEPLIHGIALQPARRATPRALAHAFVWLAACFCAAAAASAWQNRTLVERVVGDMDRYRAIAPARDAARIDALNAVKRDRDALEHYANSGVPPRIGLGFYRGAPLLPLANDLIASYQPPAPPPSTIELDSLSLFRTGSAALNPGSNRLLVAALDMIRAHPDKRVLVAGHTDSAGNPAANLTLSVARAASVRDWLADASGLPVSHFAIQGYGDTRPKVSNETEAGRAANRRVEITLVPDCRDTRDSRNDLPRRGQPACSWKISEEDRMAIGFDAMTGVWA